jgi:hypothetical protein
MIFMTISLVVDERKQRATAGVHDSACSPHESRGAAAVGHVHDLP